jgi:hypothetical protein
MSRRFWLAAAAAVPACLLLTVSELAAELNGG